MIQLDHPEELAFLQAAQGLFLGSDSRNLISTRLDFKGQGLWRDPDGRTPFLDALKDIVAKGTLNYLARNGGVTPNRYVIRDKLRAGGLFTLNVPIPLQFTRATHDLLLQVLDDAQAPPPTPTTLADIVAFHRVRTALNDETKIQSPLTDLVTLAGFKPKELLVCEEMYWILRSLGRKMTQGWVSALTHYFESKGTRPELGAAFQAYTAHCVETGRFSLLSAVGMTYKVFLRDHTAPEDVLKKAAEIAKTLRKVSEQEALLKAWGGTFTPASVLLKELDRIVAAPHVERTEEEKLFRDEVVGIRQYLGMASALADALTKILK